MVILSSSFPSRDGSFLFQISLWIHQLIKLWFPGTSRAIVIGVGPPGYHGQQLLKMYVLPVREPPIKGTEFVFFLCSLPTTA
ncbi:hypothetical protein C4D60_Mb05t19700 [Musa balbisiana]|uniref:Uncharacterized protein n=1 Tax=Musa balbisiana TaxID=52838 RepID=A0A4S8JXD8_MUSBA|nr:hypothetical protein C4D60_Mb05t19700 [Musa balbisiana]